MAKKWKVVLIESERGWGQRIDDEVFFEEDEHSKARQYVEEFNAQNTEPSAPDWYMYAKDPVLVDVADEKPARRISKQDIFDYITDLVSDFLYYDRKGDEELKVGDIEKMIEDGEITVEEMGEHFAANIKNNI